MSAAPGQLKYYTIDDIYNLPDGQRAELIDGELYMMATHGRRARILDYRSGKTAGRRVQF